MVRQDTKNVVINNLGLLYICTQPSTIWSVLDHDVTHTNKVEGLNSGMKSPYKMVHGIPKNRIPGLMDQLIFEGWCNELLDYSHTSHSNEEKDNSLNIWVMLIVILSKFHCVGKFDWQYVN